MPDKYREREIARLRSAMERRLDSPRLQMALIVSLTGAAGFFVSAALLYLGLKVLWLRYSVAVAAGYLTFLLLLWCWLRLQEKDAIEDLDPESPDFDPRLPSRDAAQGDVWTPGGGRSGGGGASAWFGENPGAASASVTSADSGDDGPDGPDGFDGEDLAGIAAIVALAGAVVAAVWVTVTAPTLLVELMLNSALAAGLYRRLGAVEERHWLRTAVEQTGWPFVVVMLGFALAGALMQTYAPHASTMGEVIQHFLGNR
jgi:hypothetical protein